MVVTPGQPVCADMEVDKIKFILMLVNCWCQTSYDINNCNINI